jgi:hypothetical protein
VLGNKADLDKDRAVSKEEIKDFEKKTGIIVKEVSAKTGTAVDNAFKLIVSDLIQRK